MRAHRVAPVSSQTEVPPDEGARNIGFGETAFSGSSFVFWSLAPVLLVCGIGVPLLVTDWTVSRSVVAGGFSAICLLAIPALYDARRFWWAARSVTAIIFLGCAAYAVDQLFLSGKPLAVTRRSQASPLNSILAFIAFGLPSLWYTLVGRFALREPAREPELIPDEIEADSWFSDERTGGDSRRDS
jgi:hypothetical protein